MEKIMRKKHLDVYIDNDIKWFGLDYENVIKVTAARNDASWVKDVVWNCDNISEVYNVLEQIIRKTDSNFYVSVCTRIGKYEKREIERLIRESRPAAEFSVCGC